MSGNDRKEFQPPPRCRNRFSIRGAMHRVDASLLKVSRGPFVVVGLLEVHGQFCRYLIRAYAVHLFIAPTDAVVQMHAPRHGHPVVENMAIHRVHEAKPAHRIAVRAQLSAALLDELMPPAQFLAADLDIRQIVVQCRGDGDYGEFRAHDAGCFEDALVARVKTINLVFNQLPDGVRHSQLDGVNRRGQLPAAFVHLDQPLLNQVVDRVHHEQRIAVSPFMDQRDKVRRETGVRGI